MEGDSQSDKQAGRQADSQIAKESSRVTGKDDGNQRIVGKKWGDNKREIQRTG